MAFENFLRRLVLCIDASGDHLETRNTKKILSNHFKIIIMSRNQVLLLSHIAHVNISVFWDAFYIYIIGLQHNIRPVFCAKWSTRIVTIVCIQRFSLTLKTSKNKEHFRHVCFTHTFKKYRRRKIAKNRLCAHPMLRKGQCAGSCFIDIAKEILMSRMHLVLDGLSRLILIKSRP